MCGFLFWKAHLSVFTTTIGNISSRNTEYRLLSCTDERRGVWPNLPRSRSKRNRTPSAYDFSSGLTVLKEKNQTWNQRLELILRPPPTPKASTSKSTWLGWWLRVSAPWLRSGCRRRGHTGRWRKPPGSPAWDTSPGQPWPACCRPTRTSTRSGSAETTERPFSKHRWNVAKYKYFVTLLSWFSRYLPFAWIFFFLTSSYLYLIHLYTNICTYLVLLCLQWLQI